MLSETLEVTVIGKPKILIDARMVSRFEHGISRYVSSIGECLVRIGVDTLPYQPVFILSSEIAGLGLPLWTHFRTVIAKTSFLSLREVFEIPEIIHREQASAFHSPSFASFPMLKVPYMQTVHDLIHLKYGNAGHKLYYKFLLRPFARRARVLATVSESAAKELSEWLPRSLNDIEVHTNTFVPFAGDAATLRGELAWIEAAGLKKNEYYLAVANDKSHKNLEMLRESHSRSAAVRPLIVAHEFMNQFDSQRRLDYGISALLRNARTVLSPSLAEGFGRVPVEALLLNTPVVISDIPAHREIFQESTNEGVSFLSPSVASDWESKFKELEASAAERPSCKLADQLLNAFSIDNLAAKINKSYIQLLSL